VHSSLTTVYLDAVLKSPQRSVVADAGALDADAGASKSNRISKAERRREKKKKPQIKLIMKRTPQAFKLSPYTNSWMQGQRIFEGTPALPPE